MNVAQYESFAVSGVSLETTKEKEMAPFFMLRALSDKNLIKMNRFPKKKLLMLPVRQTVNVGINQDMKSNNLMELKSTSGKAALFLGLCLLPATLQWCRVSFHFIYLTWWLFSPAG